MCLWTYGKMQQRSVYIPYISYEISVTAASSHLLVIVTYLRTYEKLQLRSMYQTWNISDSGAPLPPWQGWRAASSCAWLVAWQSCGGGEHPHPPLTPPGPRYPPCRWTHLGDGDSWYLVCPPSPRAFRFSWLLPQWSLTPSFLFYPWRLLLSLMPSFSFFYPRRLLIFFWRPDYPWRLLFLSSILYAFSCNPWHLLPLSLTHSSYHLLTPRLSLTPSSFYLFLLECVKGLIRFLILAAPNTRLLAFNVNKVTVPGIGSYMGLSSLFLHLVGWPKPYTRV